MAQGRFLLITNLGCVPFFGNYTEGPLAASNIVPKMWYTPTNLSKLDNLFSYCVHSLGSFFPINGYKVAVKQWDKPNLLYTNFSEIHENAKLTSLG